MNKRDRVFAYDFIRLVSCMGVFLFHANQTFMSIRPSSGFFQLPDWTGFLFVTCFFVLSGCLLEYRHGPRSNHRWDTKAYYINRWKMVFPPYYVAFLSLFVYSFIRRRLWTEGIRWTILFSFVGLDGYVSDAFKTYYLVGEWFLGALILLYLMYPLLRLALERYAFITCTVLTAIFLFTADMRICAISPLANIFSCLISLIAGILYERHIRTARRSVRIYIAVLDLYLLLLSLHFRKAGILPISWSVILHLGAFGLFQVLYTIGTLLWILFTGNRKSEPDTGICDRKREGGCMISAAAAYTYEFYLVHHVLLDKCFRTAAGRIRDDRNALFSICLLVSFVLSVFSAILLKKATAGLMKIFLHCSVKNFSKKHEEQ